MNALTSHEKTLSFGSLGGLCIRSGSGGATPKARAGSPSVARFMYKIAAGKRGKYSGPEIKTTPPMTTTSVIFTSEKIGEVFLNVVIDPSATLNCLYDRCKVVII